MGAMEAADMSLLLKEEIPSSCHRAHWMPLRMPQWHVKRGHALPSDIDVVLANESAFPIDRELYTAACHLCAQARHEPVCIGHERD